MINVLMTGDVVGESGRRAVARLLPELRTKYKLDLVIVNAENADGLGLYVSSAREILRHGADVLTLGDHIYDKFEIYDYLAKNDRIIRPLNFSPATPGHDRLMFKVGECRILVVSVIGLLKINIYSSLSPFTAMDNLLSDLETLADERQPHIILVDFHAEDIREKHALAWYLDGRVSAVVGTHTHVPTLDARILPHGTGKVTDIGMCGPSDGSLGMKLDAALTRFVKGLPSMYEVAPGPAQFNAVFLQLNEKTGECCHIERVDYVLKGSTVTAGSTGISGPFTSRTDSQALS